MHTSKGRLFLAAQAAVYALFLALDLQGRYSPSALVKYAGVCLCFAAALPLLRRGRRMFPAAMALTLIADTFLLLLDRYYLLGVVCFCCVQLLYAGVLQTRSEAFWPIIRLGALGAVLAALWAAVGSLDVLTAASAVSFSQLSVSVVQSALLARRGRCSPLLPAALGLFWCCDACVGLHNVFTYIPGFPLPGLVDAATFCVWMFYLPSQVLLVLWAWGEEAE